jgi:uncharacterized low-complexity protein
MKTNRSNLKSAVLITTTVVGGTALSFGANGTNANELLEYSSLGSGAQLRTEILDNNRISSKALERMNSETTVKFSELKCGEGKCGEGKCGEDKKEAKKDSKKEGKKAEDSKAGESKCGENTCGGSDDDSSAKEKKEDK